MTKPSNSILIRRYIGLLALTASSPLFFMSISTGMSNISNQDKIIHIIFHMIVCLWFLFAREKRTTAFLISFTYGMIIEIGQSFTVARSFELLDIAANLMGACLAIILFQLVIAKPTN